MCDSLSRRLSAKDFLLLGSVFVDGFRATHLSRQSARYRSLLPLMQSKLYHMGFRGKVSRSTLADANESHDWRIYAEFAQVLIGIARPLHAHDPMGVDLDQSLYALDSTTIDLCLSLFPWARFRQHKAAVKMHTLLDLHGNIPTFIRITDGEVHDVNILDEIMPEAGSFYVMDRGYIDFRSPFLLHTQLGLLCRAHQSECTYSNVATPIRWTRVLACAPIRPSSSHRYPISVSLSRCIASGQLPG